MKAFIAALFCCPILLAGCSTVATVVGGATGNFDCDPRYSIPRVYSGVANDIRFIRSSADSGLALLDFPFSLAGDTLILPYTLVTQAKHGSLCDKETVTTP